MPITRQRFGDLIRLEDRPSRLISGKVEEHDGYVVEKLKLEIAGREVRGLLTRPPGNESGRAAILFAHSHGGVYALGADELLVGRDYLYSPPGPDLARAGYVTLCIDMPTFGDRSSVSESAAAKARLWFGNSLFGDMLNDHRAALGYLLSREDVDPARIGAFGMSMGCTLSYWLAALDERIAAVAHVCCFADLRTMIELGAHDGHGIYLVVPGLLAEADAGAIGALIAPRPQLICIGEADELTPPLAVRRAFEETSAAYAEHKYRLQLVSEPGIRHQETESMRKATLAFFHRWLG